MMEAAPAASLIVSKAQFLFQLLVIALDPPAQFRQIDQALEGHVRREGGQPVPGGLGLTLGPFDQQPFFVPRLGPPLVTMGGPHPNPGKARCQRARVSLAPGDRLPAGRRQAERKRLDANRLVLTVAAHQLWATAATRPGQRWQRCRPRRPYRTLRRDAGDTDQSQSADLLAQPSIGAITGIH